MAKPELLTTYNQVIDYLVRYTLDRKTLASISVEYAKIFNFPFFTKKEDIISHWQQLSYNQLKYYIKSYITAEDYLMHTQLNNIVHLSVFFANKRNLELCYITIKQLNESNQIDSLNDKIKQMEEKLNIVTDFMNLLKDFNSMNQKS